MPTTLCNARDIGRGSRAEEFGVGRRGMTVLLHDKSFANGAQKGTKRRHAVFMGRAGRFPACDSQNFFRVGL